MFESGDKVLVVGNETMHGSPFHHIKLFTAAKVATEVPGSHVRVGEDYVRIEGVRRERCDGEPKTAQQVVPTECLRPLLKGCGNNG